MIYSPLYAVDLEITHGQNKALPIALVPFDGDNSLGLSKTIKKDLSRTGSFKFIKYDSSEKPHNALQANFNYWRQSGANYLIIGNIEQQGSQLSVHVQLLDPVAKAHILLSKEYKISMAQSRALAHHISNMIYQQLTGNKGIFSTRLAYIDVERTQKHKPKYKLVISDYDGTNHQTLLVSTQPIMSPSWSPGGQHIAYVSFENKKAEIYVVNVSTGRRNRLTSFPGINGAPSWSPDGRQLVVVLSKSGSPNLYLIDLNSRKLTQLTRDMSINTEPKFTADGKAITFTSNRGGSPQIYQLNFSNHVIKRLTFDGNYNASAHMTPKQKKLVILHRRSKSFSIAVQDLKSGSVTPISFSKQDESPSVSPNGKMVVYATKVNGKGRLRISTLDGKVNFTLPPSYGDMQEPAWSPYA